ncbi:MAG: hypothetical protein H7839_12170 [Magnetococcus sp. YQC-5]
MTSSSFLNGIPSLTPRSIMDRHLTMMASKNLPDVSEIDRWLEDACQVASMIQRPEEWQRLEDAHFYWLAKRNILMRGKDLYRIVELPQKASFESNSQLHKMLLATAEASNDESRSNLIQAALFGASSQSRKKPATSHGDSLIALAEVPLYVLSATAQNAILKQLGWDAL